MAHQEIQRAYDLLGDRYYSSEHKTIRYFNLTQAFPIRIAFSEQAHYLRKDLEQLDILNIGIGNGQHCEQLCLPIYEHVVGERVRWDRIVDFDISDSMLRAAKRYYPSKEYTKKTGEREPKQVRGDAIYLPFKSNEFDIVLAGLCDHVEDQEKMYLEAFRVLRPRGIFITSYPNKSLATTIRRNVYGIDPIFTRLEINGNTFLLPSSAPRPKDVETMSSRTGFELVECKNLYHDKDFTSDVSGTVEKAQKIRRKRLEELPILVFSVSRKPDNLTRLQRKELNDPYWFYN